jgi:hypothetical protein
MVTAGLHAMSNEAYHAVTDWWSSSQLKAALPERYKTGGSQEALDFGTLFHSVVLEPDTLDAYTVLDAHAIAGDNPKTGKPYDAPHMTAKFKAAVAEAEQGGKVVVAQTDWDRAHAMADAVHAHPTASALLFDGEGHNEESAFWVDGNGVQHKARFDRRIPGAVIDLKSTSAKPGGDSLTRAVSDYGYELSAVHSVRVAAGLELDAPNFAWVFVSKDPIRVTVAEPDDLLLARGRVLRALALERLTNPAVPPYEGASGYLTLTAPGWARLDETEQSA